MNTRIALSAILIMISAPFASAGEKSALTNLRAGAEGIVERINVKQGDLVRKGDLLIQLDGRPQQAQLAVALALVERATAIVAQAQAELDRGARLRKADAISQEEFDQIVLKNADAKAQLNVARGNVELAKLAVERVGTAATVDGKVTRLHVGVGEHVKPGDVLVSILPSTAQDKTSANIKALLKERHQVLTKALDLQMAMVKAGKVSIREVASVHRAALEAGLQLCETPAERIALLKKDVQFCTEVLAHAERLAQAGVTTDLEPLLAHAQLLEARIRLAREEVDKTAK